jgi:GDPmannose 4,6-dehydratase
VTHAVIVGVLGQDGVLLRELLNTRGYRVTGVARGDLDMQNADAVTRFVEHAAPDEIYFLAARHNSSEGPVSEDADLFHDSMQVHFHAPVNFLEAIKRQHLATHFLYASSSRIFAAGAGLQNEATPVAPDSIYGITKAAGGAACQFYRRLHGIKASVAILYNHESALRGGHFVSKKITTAVARIARGWTGNLELGDPDARVDWGYAPDFVEAMCRIASLEGGEDFVVATGESHSVGEFAQIAFRRAGLDWRDHVVVKSAMIRNNALPRVGDSARLRARTGWLPSITFQQMVERLVDAEMSAPHAE